MRKHFLKIILIVSGGIFLLMQCFISINDTNLHVYFLDVGQGDAILIQLPTKELILVDGGPDNKVLQEISAVIPFYENTIDLVVLTHPHADHVNGLIDVINRYTVKKVIMTGVLYNDAAYDEFLRLINEKNISAEYVKAGMDYVLGSATLDIIYPLKSIQGNRFENINNSSITFRLIFRDAIIYLNGDLEVEGEKKIIASNLDINSDVYKAGHHGSRTSNSAELLVRVDPTFAVISCGVDNSFKHPHPETINNFQKNDYEILRTDLNGRVEIITDGVNGLEVKTFY